MIREEAANREQAEARDQLILMTKTIIRQRKKQIEKIDHKLHGIQAPSAASFFTLKVGTAKA